MSDKRNINFDLLRCLSMLMIVGIHFFTHGLYKDITSWQDASLNDLLSNGWRLFNRISSEYIFLLFCTAVNCFVLITGYFMIRSRLKIRRVLGIWTQTLFYSLVIPIIFFFAQGRGEITWIVKGLTPICSNVYWFVTVYIGLMVLSPFIILFANMLNKHQYKLLLLAMGIINVVIIWKIPFGSIYSSGTSLLFFIFLFLVGGYIRIFEFRFGKEKYGRYFIIFSLLVLLTTIIQDIAIGLRHNTGLYHMLNPYNGLPFFMSVLVFLYFKNLKLSAKGIIPKVVVFISPFVFGVYLISDHPILRDWLWGLFDWAKLMNSAMLIPTMVISIILIFVVCVCLDYLRDIIFRFIHVDSLSCFLANKMEMILKKTIFR